jgi:hypothetical protein
MRARGLAGPVMGAPRAQRFTPDGRGPGPGR